MKTKSLHIILVMLLLPVFFGCDKNFEEINTDPTQLSRETMKFEYLFTSAQVSSSGNSDGYANGIWQAGLAYASTMIQHLSSTSTFWYGDKYVYNATYSGFYWKGQYTTAIKSISDVIENTREKEQQKNLYNISRIFRCFLFQRLTDVYGDLPYKNAGKGYLNGTVNPPYDRQQDIYLDMLNELDQAAIALNPQA
ncbi:MAG: SusD/RagB family nutrient-binding outer membrane lipoprotein, partial [Mucilaginibacter polytrichastri]|nr:SusD/RagB family nutrient-binding outer membrane lipoprotein [Mucilaginibacter polytrichastri]